MHGTVNFIADGLGLTPAEFAQILQEGVAAGPADADSYSLGGAVEAVEARFAQLLGKERALFVPTGTLANHLALRVLAGQRRRVLVQADSHIYRDIGDAPQTLSGLNLIPLAPGRVTFTLEEVRAAVDAGRDERVATGVGAIAIESIVRRHDDAMFDTEQMRRIADYARGEGIGLHLDGARLFVEAVHRGLPTAQQADWFDTVFVSLAKCFNSASGAVLAGPAEVIGGLHHQRRMFGGSLPQAWPQAVVALHYAETFADDYRAAWGRAEELLARLEGEPAFRVERVPAGTHIVRLHLMQADPQAFCQALARGGVRLAAPESGAGPLKLKVNPSILRASVADLARAFVEAARAAYSE